MCVFRTVSYFFILGTCSLSLFFIYCFLVLGTWYLLPCSLYPVPCFLYFVPCILCPVSCILFPVSCVLFPNIIGAVGFEPTASWSQTMRAKPLRHAPDNMIILINKQMSTQLDNIRVLNLISKIIHYHTIEEHKYI